MDKLKKKIQKGFNKKNWKIEFKKENEKENKRARPNSLPDSGLKLTYLEVVFDLAGQKATRIVVKKCGLAL